MKRSRLLHTLLILLGALAVPGVRGQARRAASAAPQIDVEHYVIQATLNPEAHEIKATATVTFKALESTEVVLFQLSENLSVQKALNAQGVEIEFGQEESGPGTLSLHFPRALEAGSTTTIKVEYSGGFERDRYSRSYSRDESSAYIGMEGTYLLYSAKWFPVNKFLVDRATADIQMTVPLGMTMIGPGEPQPVVTRGITETFGWSVKQPTLPNSVVAGRYFEKKVTADKISVDCFAREDHLAAIEKSAQALGKILDFYTQSFGPSAAGNRFRLVEVDDRTAIQHGALGSVFITHRELSQPNPPIRQLARRAAYQWWLETVGARSTEDLWLVDGMAYYAAAQYLGHTGGPPAFKEEINNLAVLALKFENRSAVRVGLGLGYRTEPYESVVAGKGAWIIHMLRQLVGDAKFTEVLQEYRKQSSGRGGSTAEFQKFAEKSTGRELGWFIAEWIDTIGVPELQAEYVTFKTRDGFRVSGTVKQDRDLFRMPLEVEVTTKGKTERGAIELSGKSTPFDVNTFALPTLVVLDPENKILRDSRDLQISVQLTLGNDLKQKGDFVEALRAYENALKHNPRKSIAHFRVAEVYYDQFNLQLAANSFRDALNGDKDPPWIEVWSYIYLGKIYDILAQRQRAMAEYNKAINTKDNTDGAQDEAKKWLAAPFTRERTVMDKESKQPD